MSALESNPPADDVPPGDVAAADGVPSEQSSAPPAGRFRYDASTDAWWWSPEMYAIHGLDPGTTITTALVLSLKHPDDRGEAGATLAEALETGRSFTHPHRVVPADDAVRHVISVGEGIVLGDRVVAIHGYMVDVTSAVERQLQSDAWDEASRMIEQRAVIERAKGALMVRYGLDADGAFELLRSWSNARNEKLREVARNVIDGL